MSIHTVMLPRQGEIYSLEPSSLSEDSKKGFSTATCFWCLHDKNVEFKANVRGMVNHEYNRLLGLKGLIVERIPGGEDFEQLGRDQMTPITCPDLYYQAYQSVLSNFTNDTHIKLDISTATFFDRLHQENVKHSANIRGLVNQRYNQLLIEVDSYEEKIPGDNDLERLGMDKAGSLRADLYFKAYGEVLATFEKSPAQESEKKIDLSAVIQNEKENIYNTWYPPECRWSLFGWCSPYSSYRSSYIAHENKQGDKALVSRHSSDDKRVRQALKKSLKNYLDAKFAHERKFEFEGKPTIFSFFIKNTDGNLDLYEITTSSSTLKYLLIKNKRECIELNENDKIGGLLNSNSFLGFVFNGNRVEIIENRPPESCFMHPSYWDSWFMKISLEDNPIRDYVDTIYPLISAAVLNVLQTLEKTTSPVIMEIGGGAGLLTRIILDSDHYPKNARYIFLELNEPSLEAAKEILKGYEVDIFKTDLIQDESYGTASDNSVDVVLGSGILTYSVLKHKEDALKILRQVHRYLKPGGHLVLAGHASSLLDARDFKSAGFNVINCTAGARQLYILQKTI